MKKATRIIIAALAVLAVASAGAWAASSKATAKCADLSVITEEAVAMAATEGPAWQTILSNEIRTAEPSDLFVDVSLECGLNTLTVVRSKGGERDTATAMAGVKVRVLVDGVEAYPGAVTFCQRKQELSAVFAGIFNATVECVDDYGVINVQCLADNCLVVNDTDAIVIDEDCLLPEELSLLLSTVSANAFNFLKADLGSGIHVVEVQAAISGEGSSSIDGKADYGAFIGKGSVTVDEVKLIKAEDIAP